MLAVHGVAIASMVAVAFLIPLSLLVQQLAQERALAQAERQAAIVATLLAVTAEPDAVEQVITTTQGEEAGRLAIHGLADGARVGTGRAGAEDVALASGQQQTVLVNVDGGLSYLEPVDIGEDAAAVVEVYIPQSALSAGVRTAWLTLTVVAGGTDDPAGEPVTHDGRSDHQPAASPRRPSRSVAATPTSGSTPPARASSPRPAPPSTRWRNGWPRSGWPSGRWSPTSPTGYGPR